MRTVTVKELKEFLENKNDKDTVYFRSAFDSFNITELKDTDKDNYPLEGFVVLKGEVR